MVMMKDENNTNITFFTTPSHHTSYHTYTADKKISEIAKAEEMRCRTDDAEQCVVPGPFFKSA